MRRGRVDQRRHSSDRLRAPRRRRSDTSDVRCRAVVFEDIHDLAARVDDPDLDIAESCVMVLRNGGPIGGPGMPEWGHLPIPAKLLRKGVTDIVRISDARMSGTSYRTIVLHVSPESAVGGPPALVQEGDRIRLDVRGRT